MFRSTLGKKTDDELMQLVAERNSNALSELYARYSPRLIRYFFRMLWKDEGKAQDFLHDLFLKIIKNPQYYEPGRKFSTWIFSVAHNMCKNEYRKQALRKAVDQSEVTDVLAFSIRPESEQDEFREALDTALQKLDEDEKHLYALRYEVELPLEEIALMLDCPVGTVKSRVFYLKKKLASHLSVDFPQRIRYGIQ